MSPPIIVNPARRTITFEDAPGFYGAYSFLVEDDKIEVSIRFTTIGVCRIDPTVITEGALVDVVARAASQVAELAAEEAERALASWRLGQPRRTANRTAIRTAREAAHAIQDELLTKSSGHAETLEIITRAIEADRAGR